MRKLLCALALIVCVAAPVAAQTPQRQAGASAAELIANAGADGVFEPLPVENVVAVRHPRSGLVCRMASDYRSRLVIFPQAARGEDVACDSTGGGVTITLYATRYSIDAPLGLQMEGAVAAISSRFPGAAPYQPGVDIQAAGAAEQQSAHFLIQRPTDRARLYSRVSIAVINGWSIKLRYSAEAPTDEAARTAADAADALWAATVRELTNQQL